MSRIKKFMSTATSLMVVLSSFIATNTNAMFGTEYNKEITVSFEKGVSVLKSEIRQDGTIISTFIRDNGNKTISYYTDEYAEDFVYSIFEFGVIIELNEESDINELMLTQSDDSITYYYEQISDNVYQVLNETLGDIPGCFTYEDAREIEAVALENPMIKDADVIWGYSHESTEEASMPYTYVTLKEEAVLEESDFDFLTDYGFYLQNVSEDFTSFEICNENGSIYDWNSKTEAMRLILTNIEEIENIDTQFEHHPLLRIDGYSRLEDNTIEGIDEFFAPYVEKTIIFKKGDSNIDGEVSISDVVAISAFISNAEKNPLSLEIQTACDVQDTGNGLNSSDAFMIQQYATGVIESL